MSQYLDMQSRRALSLFFSFLRDHNLDMGHSAVNVLFEYKCPNDDRVHSLENILCRIRIEQGFEAKLTLFTVDENIELPFYEFKTCFQVFEYNTGNLIIKSTRSTNRIKNYTVRVKLDPFAENGREERIWPK